MLMERKIREHLQQKAETMECPPAISRRIEQSYSHYLQQKRSGITMKKRLISGIAAAAILIPTAAFAAPALIEILTRTPMTAEQVQVDEVGKATLEKLYRAFPETKSFAIIDASNVQGVQTSITLQDKSGSGKKFTLHTNSRTGTIEHIIQENDGGSEEKPLIASTEQEIKAKVDDLLNKMYGNISEYEFAMEQMENAEQKTLMLNYSKKGAKTPFYQVFVQGNTISASLIGGETTPSAAQVEGSFTMNGQPDYTADAFFNDEKLLSLLKMSAADLKQELAKGKSVVEIAAAKNISKQQVIDVIATTQVEVQMQGENSKAGSHSKEQMLKAIAPKVLQLIERKNETSSKK